MRSGEQRVQDGGESVLRRHLLWQGPKRVWEASLRTSLRSGATQGPGTIRPTFEEGRLLLRA